MKKSSVFLLLLAFTYSGLTQAESLKNSDFLKLSKEHRQIWYLGAYTALGHLAIMDDKEKGQCVLKWLYDDGKDKEKQLEKSFKEYPDHPPTSIVIALLRRDCKVFLKQN